MAKLAAVTVARAALRYWKPANAAIMVAIARAESGFDPTLGGDSPAQLAAVPGGRVQSALSYNCNRATGQPNTYQGFASWGLFQIYMPDSLAHIGQAGGPTTDPCATARWLINPAHNAAVAFLDWQQVGFNSWTTYTTGRYKPFLPAAQLAVEQAESQRLTRIGAIVAALWVGGYLFYTHNQ